MLFSMFEMLVAVFIIGPLVTITLYRWIWGKIKEAISRGWMAMWGKAVAAKQTVMPSAEVKEERLARVLIKAMRTAEAEKVAEAERVAAAEAEKIAKAAEVTEAEKAAKVANAAKAAAVAEARKQWEAEKAEKAAKAPAAAPVVVDEIYAAMQQKIDEQAAALVKEKDLREKAEKAEKAAKAVTLPRTDPATAK